jgi:predicted SprT family Zn-dependent metalloprotease
LYKDIIWYWCDDACIRKKNQEDNMTFTKKLNLLFLTIIIVCVILLMLSWYKGYEFDNNPLSQDIQKEITKKEYEIRRLIKEKYNVNMNIPLVVTDKMNGKLFGMATFDTQTNIIQIFLNKKRFKESKDYMLNDVMPHEYAHALMFYFGDFSKQNSGHTMLWEKACKKLNGSRCDRFVNHDDILIDKIKLSF